MKTQPPVLPMKLYLYGILLLILVGGGCSSAAETPEINTETERTQQVHYVQVERVEPTTAPLPIITSGKLASKAEINLSFKIGGYIEEIRVQEGDIVRQGELLARLNRSEIDAQVTKARKAFEKAERDLERIRNLYQDTVATLEQVQDLETVYKVAQAELEIALFNQENAAIHAPADGRILNKFAEAEEQVEPGIPVVRLGTLGEKSQVLKLGIADRDVVRIQPGDSSHVRFDVWPNRTFKGEVNIVAAAADPRTGTFEIEVILSEQNPQLRNGFVGKVTIFPTGQSPYLRIPMGALVEANQKNAFIYVPDESGESAKRVEVNPFYIGDSFFAVDSEALKDSRVITRGAAYLRPNANINIVSEEQ